MGKDIFLIVYAYYEALKINLYICVGDAAHSIHPQAGQGLNLGITDVQCLSSAILDGIKSGADIGDNKLFLSKKYGSIQYQKNIGMMGVVDLLDRVYSSDLKSVSFVRSFGMMALNGLPPIKAQIAKFAMGKNLSNNR